MDLLALAIGTPIGLAVTALTAVAITVIGVYCKRRCTFLIYLRTRPEIEMQVGVPASRCQTL